MTSHAHVLPPSRHRTEVRALRIADCGVPANARPLATPYRERPSNQLRRAVHQLHVYIPSGGGWSTRTTLRTARPGRYGTKQPQEGGMKGGGGTSPCFRSALDGAGYLDIHLPSMEAGVWTRYVTPRDRKSKIENRKTRQLPSIRPIASTGTRTLQGGAQSRYTESLDNTYVPTTSSIAHNTHTFWQPIPCGIE